MGGDEEGGVMTATDGDLLLRAILADPAEDTHRLVYADWLDEQGQGERAEFIRVQVESAALCRRVTDRRDDIGIGWSLPEPHKSRVGWLRDRERELLKSASGRGYHCWEWMGAAKGVVPDGAHWRQHVIFDRGFVASITCTAADWLAHGDDIVAAHPVERVTLTSITGHDIEGLVERLRVLLGERWSDGSQAVPDVFAALWPRITFTLPA